MKWDQKTGEKTSSIQLVSCVGALKEHLKRKGRYTLLDRPEDIATVIAMNAHRIEVRRELHGKMFRSKQQANEIILD